MFLKLFLLPFIILFFSALRNAGFSDQQVIEIISAISAILFTNMVNRVNDTVVDFPKAD